MISLGSRDARKGLEQGFSSSNNKREMGETELEEGEACSYQDDDRSIDPDVALSYIDEKLQNVLGHFKKDFEGTVSAESLGAKFGIYGSFLPAYRRSPVWSHSRSSPRYQNHTTDQSPNTSQLEAAHYNSSAQAIMSHSVKHRSASAGSTLSYDYKPLSQNDLCRQNARTQSMQSVEAFTPKSEARDQKTIKVRIKVGSDNLPVKKNSAIYSGLGLDDSPSSSFDDSPLETKGLSLGLPFDESPAHILKIMTSFPLFGGDVLSPLPDDLLQLFERPKFLQEIVIQPSSEVNQVNSVKDNKTCYGENSSKLLDKNGSSLLVVGDGEGNHMGYDFPLKETDKYDGSNEELVSNALKLPLLSDVYSISEDSARASPKEKGYFDAAKEEPSEPISIPIGLIEKSNGKTNSAENGNKDADIRNVVVIDFGKISDSKGGTKDSSTNSDTVGLKFKKASGSRIKDPLKPKAKKSTSSENVMGLPSRKELSSGDRKKRKKSDSFTIREVVTESANDCARLLKDRKPGDTENHACRSDVENPPMPKEWGKTLDKYKDFFGDMNEEEGDVMYSPDMPCGDGLKTSEVVEKAAFAYENTSKERTSSFEIRKRAISRTNLKASSHSDSLSENRRTISDSAPAGVDTDDNWVCCDKCQKWRLLPLGSKVDSLPEKWLCSMLTWLPDMNSCSISEEESTKALRAHYQLVVENMNSLYVPVDRATCITSAGGVDPTVPSDGKVIDKLRKSSESSFQDLANRRGSSMKKKQHSVKDGSLTEPKESPLTNGLVFPQLAKYMETNQQKKRHKHKSDRDCDGGLAKISKSKSKREPHVEFPRASKKSKTRSMHRRNCATAVNKGNEMYVGSGSILATNTAGEDQMTNSEIFSSHKPPETFSKLKSQVEPSQDVAPMHFSKSDSGNTAPNKRKADAFHDPASSTPSSGKLVTDTKEVSRKKHRISKSEEKEASTSKRNSKTDKKHKSISQCSFDNVESSRKDSSCAQPLVAATSSSSKVSGSLVPKSKLKEVKGSPVESVSSSPMRISNLDKLTSGRKIISEKENVQVAVKVATNSPRCSNVDYEGGSDRSGFIRKDVTNPGNNHECQEPSVTDLQDKSKERLQEQVRLAKSSPIKQHGLSTNGGANSLDPCNGYPSEAQNSDRCVEEATGDKDDFNTNASRSGKAWKDFSSLCKNKNNAFKSNSDKGKVKMFESYDNPQDNTPVYEEKEKDSKIKIQEKVECIAEKDSMCNNQPSISKSKTHWDYNEKRSSRKLDAEKSEHVVEPKSDEKADSQNGTHHIPSKRPISNGHRIRNQDAPSPLRRDSSNQAAAALKEAKNLKHLADRLKNNGSAESTGMYFEAALKFLYGASLLESGKAENAKHGDMLQSMQIYSSTAKLCEFCAHEYEKSKDMATAALAYKCMEVAYLRVVYSSQNNASRDQRELQTVLHIAPPGESPSSSASDIDNLNNMATLDKASQARSGGSPQIAANLVISAGSRQNFLRLLSFAKDANFAMEASRKSRIAFSSAKVSMDHEVIKDGIASVKRALDFSFHDVDGLLRLVRLAKEAVSR